MLGMKLGSQLLLTVNYCAAMSVACTRCLLLKFWSRWSVLRDNRSVWCSVLL